MTWILVLFLYTLNGPAVEVQIGGFDTLEACTKAEQNYHVFVHHGTLNAVQHFCESDAMVP